MSDSEGGPTMPSDASISKSLRNIVIDLYKSGNADDLTVKRVRTRAEEDLDLPAGFLKGDPRWKQKSHDLIHEAVNKYCNDDASPEPSPAKPKTVPKKTKANGPSAPKKRKASVPVAEPEKRSRTGTNHPTDSEEDDATPRKPQRRPKRVVQDESDDDGDEDDDVKAGAEDPSMKGQSNEGANAAQEDSDSAMSVLIDDSPVPKKRQKTASSKGSGKSGRSKQSTEPKPKGRVPKTKSAQEDDPDAAEIKRLQGWLVKCGIRKIWSKELSKFDSPREKIRHLKDMLKDAGMEGKYSVEKAARIKEQRELANDLAILQEQEQRWGGKMEESGGGRPRRRAAQAAARIVVEDPEDQERSDSDVVQEEDESGEGSASDDSSEAVSDGDSE
ncbi:hypothetical protein M011DRAFT_468049 [Sporormia fimetaria CBS 119925]|uniref:Transcriptional regulator n=1 Tax=Sporormia fimetaria CBS 119925 TaxID=1340428 RepID=A0A6A6VB86_9PLEO|nr:hypothetical protein M011DRAFT_468049 [Sporormia fimetaria CBS 119925]